MTPEEIRGTKFARVARGYDGSQVNAWLADVATCVDAGVAPSAVVPPPWFRSNAHPGYDTGAVRQLAGALGFAVLSNIPRPLGVTVRDTAGGDAEPLPVAGLAWTRLVWKSRVAGLPRNVRVLDSGGQVLVTRDREHMTVAASGQVLAWRQPRQAWVDATNDDPAFWTIGAHTYRHTYLTAEKVVLLPAQRWLRFPVEGAIMTAVDQSGTTLLSLYKRRPFPVVGLLPSPATEVIVRPGRELTPVILCVIALAGSWLDEHVMVVSG